MAKNETSAGTAVTCRARPDSAASRETQAKVRRSEHQNLSDASEWIQTNEPPMQEHAALVAEEEIGSGVAVADPAEELETAIDERLETRRWSLRCCSNFTCMGRLQRPGPASLSARLANAFISTTNEVIAEVFWTLT